MVTANGLLYLTVLCCLSSVQGLEEMLGNFTASSQDISSLIGQAAARNNTKSQEFADILNYFVNLNVFEKEVRNIVVKLTTMTHTDEDKSEKIYGLQDWRNAINDALQEENVTAGFNETIEESVVKYIEHFLSKPTDFKERYQQTHLNTRRYEDDDHLVKNSSAEASFEKSKEHDEFWDMTDSIETRRIFGGNRTKIKFFPFMASVLIFDRFSCAGSIISSDLVITAASCLQLAWNNRFFRENPAFLSVRVGSHFFAVGGEVIPVFEVFFHPTYVPRTLVNNLAVMRLERNLKFRRRRVKKIDFDRRASALPVNTPGITIVGWGAKTHANKIYSAMVNRIHMAVLDFYDLQSCREIYGKKFVTRTNFCAGFITTGQGACNLDVGDPGVTGRLLVGVVSFGSPVCGRKDTPTVFTKIGYYADWIESIMEQNVPRGKVRTTTRKLSTLRKVIKLFGDESEYGPIPPLRDGSNSTKTDQDNLHNIIEEPGIPPILDTDPRYVEFETTKYIQRSGESAEIEDYKVPIKSLQSKDDMEKDSSLSNQDDAVVDSVNAKTRITKAMDSDLKVMSSEINEAEEEYVKIATASDHNIEDDLESESFNGVVSTHKMVTSMGIVEPDDDVFVEKPPKVNKKHVKEVIIEQNVESASDEALRHKQVIPIITKDYNEFNVEAEKSHSSKKKHKKRNKRKKKTERKKKRHSTTPSDDNVSLNSSSAELIEFGPVGQQKNDSLDSDYTASQTAEIQRHGNHQLEPHSEVTEELIEREIEKLISQLDFSDEESSISKNRKIIDNTNVQKAMHDKAKDHGKKDVWTLLYISDGEKNIKPRSHSDIEEQGLNIDPEPFMRIHQTNTESNKTYELIDKSEIYEIFAQVMKAVVNKTAHY